MPNSPTVLYKYLRRNHANAMVTSGTVRIGTLWEYREVERHGTARGDAEEGFISAVDWVSGNQPQNATVSASPSTRIELHRPDEDQITAFSMYATPEYFQTVEEWPNCYVYCLSQSLDPKSLAAFSADTVVRIQDPINFFHALTRSLLKKRLGITYYYFGTCGYQDRGRSFEEPAASPGFIKDSSYAYQHEVRAIWLTSAAQDDVRGPGVIIEKPGAVIHYPPRRRSTQLTPVIVKCRPITKYCSLVDDSTISQWTEERNKTARRKRVRKRGHSEF